MTMEGIGQGMIMSIKTIYSEEIINQLPEEKREYFFDLINSIPDDLFEGTKNPVKVIEKGKKLSSFLYLINHELKKAGMDMESLEKNMKENNDKYKKLLRGF
jgi:hypothetical protein